MKIHLKLRIINLKFSSELLQKPDVVLVKKPDVGDFGFHRDSSFYAPAKGKTGIFVGIDLARFKNSGVNHACATKFQPTAFANPATIALTNIADDINFKRGFSEAEVMRPESG